MVSAALRYVMRIAVAWLITLLLPAFRSTAVPTRWLRADSEHPPRRTVRRPSLPHTPVARACGTGRHIERPRRCSALPALADWLPPPKARSPLAVLVLPGCLPSCRQSRCNTARHHHSRPYKGSVHWCRDHPNTAHAACAHNVRSEGARPGDPGRRESPPSIRPSPSSRSYAASFVGSLRMCPSQCNLHDDRG